MRVENVCERKYKIEVVFVCEHLSIVVYGFSVLMLLHEREEETKNNKNRIYLTIILGHKK